MKKRKLEEEFELEDVFQGRPLGNRVLIEPIPEDDITAGGIIIPDMAKDRPQIGIVKQIGDGQKIVKNGVEEVVPIPVEVGDVVLYSRYSGVDIRLGGEDATIMSADDMLFVLAPEQAREFLQVA